MKKTFLFLFLTTLFLLPTFATTTIEAVLRDGNNKNKEDGPVSFPTPVEVTYAPSTLVEGDNTVYHRDLSFFLSLLATDIYDNAVLDTTGTTKEIDNTALYKALGLKNVEETTVKDVTDVVLAMDTYNDGSKDYTIVFVTIQGTNGTYAQWSSNFDVGADTPFYLKINTDNAYWKNRANYRGFDIVANKVQEILEAYRGRYVKTKEKETILVFTGHSRGATVAAILGSYYC